MTYADLLNVSFVPGTHPGGQTLVFGHGYGCDQSLWAGIVEGLPDHNRVLFDWPGVGGSHMSAYDPRRHRSLDAYAEDLLRLLAELQLWEVTFVGHSVGASIGALAALSEPGRFAQLCMVSPSPSFADDLPDYVGGFARDELEELVQGLAANHMMWARSVARLVVGQTALPVETEKLERAFCAMDPTVAYLWARATFFGDVRDAMRRVPTPTVIMQSTEDVLAPIQVGAWMARNMPLARLHVLEATGHCPHLTSPAEVVRVLRASLFWRG